MFLFPFFRALRENKSLPREETRTRDSCKGSCDDDVFLIFSYIKKTKRTTDKHQKFETVSESRNRGCFVINGCLFFYWPITTTTFDDFTFVVLTRYATVTPASTAFKCYGVLTPDLSLVWSERS